MLSISKTGIEAPVRVDEATANRGVGEPEVFTTDKMAKGEDVPMPQNGAPVPVKLNADWVEVAKVVGDEVPI